jgi:Lipocalin-like domain
MNRRNIFSLSLITALGLALLPAASGAQQKSLKELLVGTWTAVSTINTATNGTKSEPFGPNPKGLLIFESNGRFSLITVRPDLPKCGTNNRATGTADENKAVLQGSIAYFGTYSVNEADKSYAVQIEGATFPNWAGTTQKRGLSISGDELTFINAAGSAGGYPAMWSRRSDHWPD